MNTQFFSVGLIALLGAMSPGPDFAVVTKNTLLHSKKSGLFTTLGVGAALIIHMIYCVFGLAVIIANSIILFSLINFAGAVYLIYLGLSSLFSKQTKQLFTNKAPNIEKTNLLNVTAFRQGFLCNLLNPKATLFFLSLFTVLIRPGTSLISLIIYAVEIVVLSMLWFCSLTMILSHPRVKRLLDKTETLIVKMLGLFLIGFGVVLIFVRM